MSNKLPQLITVDVFYGYKCNLRCNGCSTGSNIIRHETTDPPLDSVLESINNLSKHFEVKKFSLLGGEPFLYWGKVQKIIEHISDKFPDSVISIITNGLLLNKFIDDIFELSKRIDHIEVEISNHYELFSEDPVAQKFERNVMAVLLDERMVMMGEKQYKSRESGLVVRVVDYPTFVAQFMPLRGKLKPFATNDPAGSFSNGCFGQNCTALSNSKLYKCARFVHLPDILKQVGQLDDPDWGKYLAYQPIDLTDGDLRDSAVMFAENQGKHIDECDMCSNKHVINLTVLPKTRKNVLGK